uniref:CD55 molecule, decay accelerating factor for complement (Cromer blood group) n=1 Tax=Nothobranchius korthausae TaxID=1143690 RepID=A0A1A8H783_9TELE
MSLTAFFLLSFAAAAQGFNCGPLPELSHGNIDYPSGTETDATAVLTCKTGFNLVGQNEIMCGDQGWSGRLPVCEAITCSPPADVVNGGFSPQREVYKFQDAVSFSCKKGFTLSGRTKLTCTEQGTFSPAPPTCVLVKCEDPVIPNAEFVGGSRPPHGYAATVEYRCKAGFKMTGSSSLKCEMNSRWSPEIPKCSSSGHGLVGGVVGGLVSIAVLVVQFFWM